MVKRGVLGYSLVNLKCIIDYSFSHNVTFLFQLINRVTRLGKDKFYYKLTSKELMPMNYGTMNVVSNLVNRDIYKNYQEDRRNIRIPIFDENRGFIGDKESMIRMKKTKEGNQDESYYSWF